MERYGRLNILSIEPYLIDKGGNRRKIVKCSCECGTIKTFRYSDLRSGRTKSCGCLNKEIVTTHGDGRKNKPHHYLYQTWKGMMKRCYNPKSVAYKYYGFRNIKICNEWHIYENFKKWIIENLGERPKGMSIDRIDVNGNYEPSNCRWATTEQQNKNRRI